MQTGKRAKRRKRAIKRQEEKDYKAMSDWLSVRGSAFGAYTLPPNIPTFNPDAIDSVLMSQEMFEALGGTVLEDGSVDSLMSEIISDISTTYLG